MISKTQIAMFAIAAFALSGMMTAPAFASVVASDQHTMTSGYNGGSATDRDNATCAGENCHVDFAAFSGTSTATVYFGVTGNVECDADLYLSGSGWNEHKKIWNVDYANGYTVINGPNSIDVSDTMTYTAVYTNCS